MRAELIGHLNWDARQSLKCQCNECHTSGDKYADCGARPELEVRINGKRKSLCQSCFREAERAEIRGGSRRDPEEELNPRRIDLKPGRRNSARLSKSSRRIDPISGGTYDARDVFTAKDGSTGLRPKRKPLIGRRKTVRMSASGLITRRNRRKAKSAMFRMGQKAKLLACHACNRSDFATEKSLKRHTEKFHTPGQKSPRGFRTARSAERGPGRRWNQKYKRGHSRKARGEHAALTARELGALLFAHSEGSVGPGCQLSGRMTVRRDTLRMLDRKGLLTWGQKRDGEGWYVLTSRGRFIAKDAKDANDGFAIGGRSNLRSHARRYRRDAE